MENSEKLIFKAWHVNKKHIMQDKCEFCNDARKVEAIKPNGGKVLVNCDCSEVSYGYYVSSKYVLSHKGFMMLSSDLFEKLENFKEHEVYDINVASYGGETIVESYKYLSQLPKTTYYYDYMLATEELAKEYKKWLEERDKG